MMSTLGIELQPVQVTSPSICQRSLSCCVTARLKVSGMVICALASLDAARLIVAFGPVTSIWPVVSYLILERYDTPTLVAGETVNNALIF